MDIEKLITNSIRWQKVLVDIFNERNDLVLENKALKANIDDLIATESRAGLEIRTLKQSVTALQDTVIQKYDYKEECEKLKSELEKTHEDWSIDKSSFDGKIHELSNEIILLKENHALELTATKSELESSHDKLETQYKQELGNLKRVLENEKQKRIEDTNDKEGEFVKMKMEYENKIMKLQVQQTKLQNKVPQSSTSNEIFRKKLQHAQEVSSKEIIALREHVAELQRRLSTAPSSDHFIAGYSRHIANSTTRLGGSMKRRKLN